MNAKGQEANAASQKQLYDAKYVAYLDQLAMYKLHKGEKVIPTPEESPVSFPVIEDWEERQV